MSSLATLLLEMGKAVSGCDVAGGGATRWLAERGVHIDRGHAPNHVSDADLVIASAAIPVDHPELVAGRQCGTAVVSHAQALAGLMAARRGVAVAGTHGKSTTTALIAHVLATAGRDPTLIGGAVALDFESSSRLGRGPELVAEADEYGRRFLELHPDLAVITGIEPDHLDYYGDLQQIVAAFEAFVGGMSESGVVVTFEDRGTLSKLQLARQRVRYGWDAGDWRVLEYRPIQGGGCTLRAIDPAGKSRAFRLSLSGRHNVENALAAIVVAHVLQVDDESIRRALTTFRGAKRRFESKLQAERIWIVDDYAHHPTAVAATLQAARDVHSGPIWAVFQPHTAHRTAALLDEFAAAFDDADHVLVLPIYRPPGREVDTVAVSHIDLTSRMQHPDTVAVDSFDECLRRLAPAVETESDALILTLGAGDVTDLADEAVRRVIGDNRIARVQTASLARALADR